MKSVVKVWEDFLMYFSNMETYRARDKDAYFMGLFIGLRPTVQALRMFRPFAPMFASSQAPQQ